MNPYEELGVDREASDKEVRRAYRQRAKDAHPDGGGSPEAFERLSACRDLLLDPRRRQRYDRTGEFGEAEPDNQEGKALGLVMQTVFGVLAALEKTPERLERTDVMHLVREDLRLNLESVTRECDRMRADLTRLRRIQKRFRVKGKRPNLVQRAFDARAVEIERAVANQEDTMAVLTMAAEIARHYEFDHEKGPGVQMPGYFMNMTNC